MAVALPEYFQEVEESSRPALADQDFALLGVRYRHGNFRGIGVEALNEPFPLLRRSASEGKCIVRKDLAWCSGVHAIPFPGQEPEPIPSFGGAGCCGWAMGVAFA